MMFWLCGCPAGILPPLLRSKSDAGPVGIILADQLLACGTGEYRFIAYPLEEGRINLQRGQPVKPSLAIKEICSEIYASNIERCRYGMLSTAEAAMLKAGISF